MSVTSKADLVINGDVDNFGGKTVLTSTQGQIENISGSTFTVNGRNIELHAATGIGAASAISVDLLGNSGTLTATSTSGNIDLHETSGPMRVAQVTTSNTSGDVTLTSTQGILGVGSGNLVKGATIKLFADGHYGSTSFLLVGMAQLKHPAGGVWQTFPLGSVDEGKGGTVTLRLASPIAFDEIVETTGVSLHVEDLLMGRFDADAGERGR